MFLFNFNFIFLVKKQKNKKCFFEKIKNIIFLY